MTIQYLLDEHIASLYRTQLMRQVPDLVVRMIGDRETLRYECDRQHPIDQFNLLLSFITKS